MSTDTKGSREIEVKARLSGSLVTWESRFAQILKSEATPVHKRDTYYQSGDFSFRLRSGSGGVTLTFKDKSVMEGIEINREWETNLTSQEVFQVFLERMGAARRYIKEKKGWLFCEGDLRIELVEVSNLGVFVEVEVVLAPDAQRTLIQRTQERLLSTLERLGISQDAIEERLYQELLDL